MRGAAAAIVLVCAGLAPAPGAAQVIPVRSGEHAGFSRLVLDIGAGRAWDLAGAGRERRLVLDPAPEGFDIGSVFALIPRDRLSGLAAGDGLSLSLACDCPVEASRYADRYLVIDIRDAPEGPGPTAREAERRAAADRLPDLTRLLMDGPDGGAGAPDPAPREDAPPVPPASEEIDLDEAARMMAEQLARAAASGLLDAAPARPLADADPVPRPAPRAPVETPVEASGPPGPAAGPEGDPRRPPLPLRAETAFDAALHRGSAAEPQRPRLACTGEELRLADWAAGPGVDRGLGSLRRALFDGRDRLQRDAVLALARHYLHFGFGAEAAHWLRRIEDAPPDLLVIAALVDARDGPRFPRDPDPAICSDGELLWRYLDGALAAGPGAAGRLQRAAAALPPALRDQVVPRLARQLFEDGFEGEARNLRDLLSRAGSVPQAVLLQLDLDLGVPRADHEATRAALELALRDDGADPVSAMAHALAFDRRMGLVADGARRDAAHALLREYGIDAQTATLWHELVLAQGAAGEIGRALRLLQQDGLPPGARDAVLTALIAERLAADDLAAVFVLARSFGTRWQAGGSEAGRARVAAIARLRAAGLTEAAEMLRDGQRMLILPARPQPDAGSADGLRIAWQGEDWPRLAEMAAAPHAGIAERLSAEPDDAARGGAGRGDAVDLPALARRVEDSGVLRAEVASLLAAPAPRAAEPPE